MTSALERLEAFETSKRVADWRNGMEQARRATGLAPEVADYWRTLGYAYSLGGSEGQTAATQAEERANAASASLPSTSRSIRACRLPGSVR